MATYDVRIVVVERDSEHIQRQAAVFHSPDLGQAKALAAALEDHADDEVKKIEEGCTP